MPIDDNLKMKRKLLIFLFFVSVLGVRAQFSEQLSFPNWYISLYSGVNLFMGQGNIPFNKDSYFSASNNLNPLSTIGVGRDFSKLFSIRTQLGWLQYSWSMDGSTKRTSIAGTLTTDFMFSITRLIGNYDPNRTFELQLFVGGGGGVVGSVDYQTRVARTVFSPIGRGGVVASFYLARRFAVNVDLATNFLSDRMDGVVSPHFKDNYTSIMIGFTYHLVGCNCKKTPHNKTYPQMF